MQWQLTHRQLLPIQPQVAWTALNDVTVLRSCLPGCESLTALSADQFEVHMRVRIGPFTRRLHGKIRLCDVDPARSYTLQFQSGTGETRAEARVLLESNAGNQTLLSYTAGVALGTGLLALGAPLLDIVARRLADEFFAAFNARVRHYAPVPPPSTSA